MSRNFGGGTDVLTCGIGGLAALASSAQSYAIVCKRNSTGWNGLVTVHDSGGAARMGFEIENHGADKVWLYGDSGGFSKSTYTILNADGWVLIGASHPGGTAVGRLHKYVFSTNAWTHENGGSITAQSVSVAGGSIKVGNAGGGDVMNGDIACAAAWMRQLTDAEFENLAINFQYWLASAPDWLVLLDQQLTTQTVVDWTGKGGGQTALTATTVSANSVPLFGYGHRALSNPQAGAAGSALTYDQTDTLGLTDTAEIVNTFDRSFTETLGLLDYVSKNPGLTVEDIMGLLDTAGPSRGMFQEFVDGLGLTDSAESLRTLEVFVTDVLGLTDVAASQAVFQQAFVEALGLTDSQEWVATFSRAFTEAVGLTDSTTTTSAFLRDVADGLGLTDDAAIDKVIALTVVDGLGLTDEAVTNMQFRKAFVETVGLLDSIEPVAQYLRIVADSLGATDTVATQVDYILTITDPLGLVDGISVIGGVPFIIRALPATTLRSKAIYGVRTKRSMPGRVYSMDSQRNRGIFFTTTDEMER